MARPKVRPGRSARRGPAPESVALRILRYLATGFAPLLVAAGIWGTLQQAMHAAQAQTYAGTIIAAQRPTVDVQLDGGDVVRIARVTRNTTWYPGKPVEVACLGSRDRPEDCRMTTNLDRWIDSVGGLLAGLVCGAIAVLLWRRANL